VLGGGGVSARSRQGGGGGGLGFGLVDYKFYRLISIILRRSLQLLGHSSHPNSFCTLWSYIYRYIYICVCVCVCVYDVGITFYEVPSVGSIFLWREKHT
jgi:hypothetical protein